MELHDNQTSVIVVKELRKFLSSQEAIQVDLNAQSQWKRNQISFNSCVNEWLDQQLIMQILIHCYTWDNYTKYNIKILI